MTTLTSTELKQHLGESLELAQREPVAVSKSGRPYAVIISKDEYERLQAIEDREWGRLAQAARQSGDFVGHDEAMEMFRRVLGPDSDLPK